MPNPNEDIECKRCHDTGLVPGTDRLCSCVGGGCPYCSSPATIRVTEVDGKVSAVCANHAQAIESEKGK